jgi:hypothetical protein
MDLVGEYEAYIGGKKFANYREMLWLLTLQRSAAHSAEQGIA